MSGIQKKEEILRRFRCRGSGACCRAGGYVAVSDADIKTMANRLQMDDWMFRQQMVVVINGWSYIATPSHRVRCFLDEQNRCKVYEARPKACRTYPDWPEIWESDESLELEMKQCVALRKAVQDAC